MRGESRDARVLSNFWGSLQPFRGPVSAFIEGKERWTWLRWSFPGLRGAKFAQVSIVNRLIMWTIVFSSEKRILA